MTGTNLKHRLAAILAADAAGYSRLMGADERGTVAALDAARAVFRQHVEASQGRIVDTAGDSVLAVFETAAGAASAAIAIQREFVADARNRPQMQRLRFRIGLHLGDIIEKIDGTVYGDGINIAARLQAMAPLGGVCASSMVHDQLRDDVRVLFEDLGQHQLKNISRPIRAFVADLDAAGVHRSNDSATVEPPAAASIPRPRRQRPLFSFPKIALIGLPAIGRLVAGVGWYWPLSRTAGTGITTSGSQASFRQRSALSIIVLPFANQTGNPEKTYIADAITSTITSDLSRIRGAFIIPPSTAFAYRAKNMSAQEAARDAGIRFVLHGSVLAASEKIRISVQLADAQTGGQLWGETFDGDLSNLFVLHDRITRSVVDRTRSEMLVVTARESEMRKSIPTVADLILRARALNLKPQSLENWQHIERLLRQALALEPNNSLLMSYLAVALLVPAKNFPSQLPNDVREKNIADGFRLAQEARKLDPRDPMVYLSLAIHAGIQGDGDGNRQALEAQLELQPYSPDVRTNLAAMYIEAGEPKRAVKLLTEAIDLRPKGPRLEDCANLGEAYFMLGDYDAAIEWTSKAFALNPAVTSLLATLAMGYVQKGEDAKARAVVEELLRKEPNFRLPEDVKPRGSTPEAYRKYYERIFLPAWRKAGLPE